MPTPPNLRQLLDPSGRVFLVTGGARTLGRAGVLLTGTVVSLTSDAAAYVTGHNFVVGGGFSIWL